MRKSYLLLIILGLFIALITGSLSFYSLHLVNQANNENQKLLIYQRSLLQLLSEIKDAETGQRGFIITGQNSFLEPYQESLQMIQTYLATIEKYTTTDDLKNPLVQELKRMTQLKLNEMEKVIQVRQKLGFQAAADIVENRKGKRQMDNIRQIIGQLLENTAQKIKQKEQDVEQLNNYALLLNALSGLTAFFLIAIYSYLSYRDSSRLNSAQVTLNQTLELYRAIVESSKQILISTNKEGIITSFNKEAEKVLGYKSQEVVNQKAIIDFFDLTEIKRQVAEKTSAHQGALLTDFDLITSTVHYLILADSEWAIKKRNQTSFMCKQVISPLRDETNEIQGYVFNWQDLSEQKKWQFDIQHIKEIAEKADTLHQQQLENLIQEMRIPVNGINSLAQLLSKNKNGNLNEQEMITAMQILENCQLLQSLLAGSFKEYGQSLTDFASTHVANERQLFPLNILVVDDEFSFRQTLKLDLMQLGARVIEAQSGEEALKKCQLEEFDLITLDLLMDSMDGIEVAKQLISHEQLKFVPIVVISAIAKKMEGKIEGVFAYLEKPVHLNDLQELLQKIQRKKLS